MSYFRCFLHVNKNAFRLSSDNTVMKLTRLWRANYLWLATNWKHESMPSIRCCDTIWWGLELADSHWEFSVTCFISYSYLQRPRSLESHFWWQHVAILLHLRSYQHLDYGFSAWKCVIFSKTSSYNSASCNSNWCIIPTSRRWRKKRSNYQFCEQSKRNKMKFKCSTTKLAPSNPQLRKNRR